MGTNWLDILIVGIIGWHTLIGVKAGFLGGLARLVGSLLGLVAALNFYRPLADMVNLKWGLVSTIGGRMPVSALAPDMKSPGSTDTLFHSFGAGGSLFSFKGPLQALQGVEKSISNVLASGILDIICFLFLFFVVSWVVKTLGSLLGKMAKLFFLGPADRVGGVLLGAAKGMLMAMVLVALANSLQVPAAFMSSSHGNNAISLAMQKSTLVPYFIKALVILNVSFPSWGI